ncbi:hypothetical protein CLF_112033 [Clonorchis sinensis]|uniref:Uncharacterized protein n=1 Tax=Clonorchis sinensis TaxID=79923 RepID=G7YM77_CLOSI|nr:hypothetical protein CLF_112033 [Clonorchis sinensis]
MNNCVRYKDDKLTIRFQCHELSLKTRTEIIQVSNLKVTSEPFDYPLTIEPNRKIPVQQLLPCDVSIHLEGAFDEAPWFQVDRKSPSSRSDRFARPASHSAASFVHPSSVTALNISKSVFKLLKPVYLATFNVDTLKQAVQQVAAARTLDSISIDVCCLSGKRTQDASNVIESTAPSLYSRFQLHTSGDAEAAEVGYACVGVVLSERALPLDTIGLRQSRLWRRVTHFFE